MNLLNNKIAFIGCGCMAEAIIKGLLRAKTIKAINLIAADVNNSRLAKIRQQYKIKTTFDNLEAIKTAQIIILAVKPQNMGPVLEQIKPGVKSQLIISIAAGITTGYLKKELGTNAVVRVMPNNPALIGQGLTAIAKTPELKPKQLKLTQQIFGSIGETLELKESQMDALTALSGSGPGFIYLIIEAFIEAALAQGFSVEVAEQISLKTFLGTIKTAVETKLSAAELKAMVASPGGTTQAGLKVLDKAKLKKSINDAVKAAVKRSKELSR